MDKIDWRILQEIYTEKSMLKVSEKLYISQPAVSYRLSKMESEFKRPLFIRNTRGVLLTEAGMRLHKYAHRMLQYSEEITATVQHDPTEYMGEIRIGTTASFANYHLTEQLRDFCNIYPNIHISLDLYPSDTLFEMFNAGKLPIAVVRGNRFATKKEKSYIIFDEPIVVIAKESITPEYLRSHPFIQNRPDVPSSINALTREWISNNFETPPQISQIQISGDSRFMVSLVKAGFGWTIISKLRLEPSDNLYFQPIFKPDGSPYQYKTQCFYSDETDQRETYQIFLQHFKSFFKEKYGTVIR